MSAVDEILCERFERCSGFAEGFERGEGIVEASDWGCKLRVRPWSVRPPAFVGIRAHHIDFVESADASDSSAATGENVFPCWLAGSSETPFRITLYLRMHQPPRDASDFQLQAEVFKEKWQRFRDRPQPWHVRLSPDSLFVMPE